MVQGLLRSRIAPRRLFDEIEKMYIRYGEFYEDKTNAHGGKDFLSKDLDAFLVQNPGGKEYGKLKDYSSQIERLEGFSIPIGHSNTNSYLQKNYDR